MLTQRLAIVVTVGVLAACDGGSNRGPASANEAPPNPIASATGTPTTAPSTPARDAGVTLDAASPPASPPSLCGADDRLITQVSTAWGPAWSKPDPNKIVDGWPLMDRYELWWVPMPAGVLSYRIVVPATFDADPSPNAWAGYVRTAESPSTPAASYEGALSEAACDTKNGVPIQAATAPYALSPSAPGTGIGVDVYFRVRPKNATHCDGDWPLPCLEPGRTYYLNLRLTDGCKLYDEAGNVTSSDPSKCQPMIHVMRPKQIGEP